MKLENPNKLFPLLVTSRLAATKSFYLDKLGFSVTFDLPTYLQVRSADDSGPELCFMSPDGFHDGTMHPEFAGQGVYMSIPTRDVNAKHEELVAKDLKPLNAPSDKPWGWRSFQLLDPNGLVLDFFHVIEAKSM